MSAPDLALRIAVALGLVVPIGACASAQSDVGTTTGAGGATASSTGTGPGLQIATNPDEVPLPAGDPACPPEPPPPPNGKFVPRGGCQMHMACDAPLEVAPAKHFPAPFERCNPQPGYAMGGGFAPNATTEARKRTPDVCCYGIMELHPAGRPLRHGGHAQIAELIERSDWLATEVAPTLAEGSVRATLAEHFRRAGQIEHSSVASFSTTALALLSLGAPASLVEETLRAAMEEIEHAKLCFALAASLDGREIGPGPLTPPVRPDLGIHALVESLVVDGCLGEVAGALEAEEAALGCDDLMIRGALERIAREEAAHAELAYRTLAWLLEAHPAEAREAAQAARAQIDDITVINEASADTSQLRRHGILAHAERAAIARDAKRAVAEPLLGALLG